jgi:AcrR family transcriptional regulator
MLRSSFRATQRERAKRDIADGARTLFAEQGVQATSMSDIAESVGLTPPALYHYFEDRDQLVAWSVLGNVEACLDVVLAGPNGSCAADTLRLRTARYIDAALTPGPADFRLFYRVMLEALDDEAIQTAYNDYFARVREATHESVAAGQTSGEFRRDVDADALVSNLIEGGVGVHIMWLRRPSPDALRRRLMDVLDAFLLTLVSPPAGPVPDWP